MSNRTQTLPIREWYVRLERVHDEAAALDAWRSMVKAQGWSAVGDPWIVQDGTPAVVGRLVQHPDLTVSPDAFDVVLPA